ncbi:YeiH family protein [Desulfurobacterium sp.]
MREILKGLLACLAVALLSLGLGKLFPSLGADTFAILIGIVVGNTLARDKSFQPGIKFAEQKILALAIALLGVGLNLHALIDIGLKGAVMIIVLVAFVITVNYVIGRLLGFSRNFSILMGTGNAVCGSSAIAAVAPVIKAHEDEVGIPVAVVNLVGTILMFILPVLAVKVFHYDVIKSGALIGGGLQSVGQVVVAGTFLNLDAARFAILFKMVRILMIGVLVVLFSYMFGSESNVKAKKFPIPMFIVGFFALSILASSGYLPMWAVKCIKIVGDYLLVVAIAAIGMRVKFSELLKEGPKALLFGVATSMLQISFLVILIHIFL